MGKLRGEGQKRFLKEIRELKAEIDRLGREYFGEEDWRAILRMSGYLSHYELIRLRRKKYTLGDRMILERLYEMLQELMEGV